ncbi:DinB family protein [Microbacterium sp. MPKO10]|uniref:DinB family protein n=1 Tax=Microbacterium sp. MPKO10 TaxID=2989818 RepID=UPI002235EAE1|nr:DinB family protein [Microbacterium sp. MPKO10]MCW4459036.1 DinB family protein [Microbacterium sp. MPKO10]
MTSPTDAALLARLDSQRQHVLGIVDGLDDAAMSRRMLPSNWSITAMLHHLALDDERFWFGGTVAGEHEIIDWVGSGGDGWDVPPHLTGSQARALYEDACERSNAILLSTSFDAAPRWWPDALFGDYRLATVRDVVLHMLIETATHAGHLDAARELIDERQWLVFE